MHLEKNETKTCAVTRHVIEEVAVKLPKLFKTKKGKTKVHAVLYYLGFDIKNDIPSKNVKFCKNILVRCNDIPSKAYRADVYKGRIRKDIKEVTDSGEVIYHKNKLHPLSSAYSMYEVLQSDNLFNWINEDSLIDIDTFGGRTKQVYTEDE